MARLGEQRQAFRAVLEGDRCVHPASVYDPISARIAEDLGFEVGMLAGSVASMTVLGAPDIIVLTMPEFAETAHRICRAGALPLLVDADHAYGNALNVMRTVEALEYAGISGMSIEDTVLPRPHGGGGKPELISIDEGVGKIRAAVEARADPGLVIAGRTSAAGWTGVDDAIARLKAYEAAGADALFLVGVKSRADLDRIADAVGLPLITGGLDASMMDLDYLSARGVRICLQGHQPFAAAVEAVRQTMSALRDGAPPNEIVGVASKEVMRRVTRAEDYDEWTEEFL